MSAAYTTTIKKGGTPVAFTAEPTTVTTGYNYQINTAIKRVLAPNPVVKVDGVTVTTGYTINRLTGIVTFDADPVDAVTVDGSYIPVAAVAGAFNYSLDLGGELLDNTNFASANANSGFRSRIYGMHDVSAKLSRFDDISNDFKDLIMARTPVLIEIKPANASETIKAWFVPESVNSSGAMEALEEEELSFQFTGDSETEFYWS